LLGLGRKECKIISIRKEREIIEMEIMSKKEKVRSPECNKFTGSKTNKKQIFR